MAPEWFRPAVDNFKLTKTPRLYDMTNKSDKQLWSKRLHAHSFKTSQNDHANHTGTATQTRNLPKHCARATKHHVTSQKLRFAWTLYGRFTNINESQAQECGLLAPRPPSFQTTLLLRIRENKQTARALVSRSFSESCWQRMAAPKEPSPTSRCTGRIWACVRVRSTGRVCELLAFLMKL